MSSRKGMFKRGIPLRLVVILMFLAGIAISALVLSATFQVTDQYGDIEAATQDFLTCQNDVYAVRDTIHSLNEYARDFVVSGNADQAIQYFNEVQVRRSVENARQELKSYLVNDRTLKHLETAVELSDQMSAIQWYAMRLAIEAYGYDLDKYPALLKTVELSDADLALSPEAQLDQALGMLFSKDYILLKGQVDVRINLCKDTLAESMTSRHQESSGVMQRLLKSQRLLIIGLVGVLLLVLLFVLFLVVYPINRLVRDIRGAEQVSVRGSSELLFLAETYNQMHQQMEDANTRLNYKATHDALTGLYNRSSYEALREQSEQQNIALLIVDVDHFKEVNDTYGHDIGDKVLVRVAKVLLDSFREADKVCRIGGDEFSVIMMGANSSLTETIQKKIEAASALLNVPDAQVPAITISVGCAFSDQLCAGENLFKNADRALYSVKENGRNGCGFYRVDNCGKGNDSSSKEGKASI